MQENGSGQHHKGKGRGRASGRARRLAIIEATLRVLRDSGLRAVTHRAVAREAGVPLASTTYYFRDLEDLITESFLHWSAAQQLQVTEFHERATALLGEPRGDGAAVGRLAEALADATADHIVAQVSHRGDRVLEFAFLHEAARLPRLRAVVGRQQQSFLDVLARFHAALGSRHAAVDAQISYSLILGLEKGAVLASGPEVDRAGIRVVLRRYLLKLLETTPEGN